MVFGATPGCWWVDLTGACAAPAAPTASRAPLHVSAAQCASTHQLLIDVQGVEVVARVYDAATSSSCASVSHQQPCLSLKCDAINVSDDPVAAKYLAPDGTMQLATKAPLHAAERFIVTPLYEPCAAAAQNRCLFHSRDDAGKSDATLTVEEQCEAFACSVRVRNLTRSIARLRQERLAKRLAAEKARESAGLTDDTIPAYMLTLPKQVQRDYITQLNRASRYSDVVDTSAHVAPLADRVVLPTVVASCLDPRFPARMPLVLLPLAAPPRRNATPTSSDLLTCYGAPDIVCSTIRRDGEWEPNILRTVVQMLDEAKEYRFGGLRHALAKLLSNVTTRLKAQKAIDAAMAKAAKRREKDNFGVEYLDIGANVGAFVLSVHRAGYPVTAFEALPYNMQLLATTLCVNGLRRPNPASHKSDATVANTVVSDVVRSNEGTHSIVVHHTALGREKDLRCVMMSEDLNFGDTWISCNATHVESTEEFPFQKYRRRGFVNMTQLDAIATTMSHSTPHRRHIVTEVLRELQETFPSLTANFSSTTLDALATAAMPPRFWFKDYVAKIDVEGHEIAVMEGADALLQDPNARPIAIVSEVWLSLNMTRYNEIMSSAGYIGWSIGFRMKFSSQRTFDRYVAMRGGQDTVVWIQEAWEGVLAKHVFPLEF